eukprot:2984108-Lingulodinium_polyedra.AAC.1
MWFQALRSARVGAGFCPGGECINGAPISARWRSCSVGRSLFSRYVDLRGLRRCGNSGLASSAGRA